RTGVASGHTVSKSFAVRACRELVVGAESAAPARDDSGIESSRTGPSSRRGCDSSSYSARRASDGEIRLARHAGMKDATSAQNPSVRTATKITPVLYGFSP